MLKENSNFSTQRTIELLKNLTRNMISNSSDSPCDLKEPKIPPRHCDKELDKMDSQNLLSMAKSPSPQAYDDNLAPDRTLLSVTTNSTASKITRPVGEAVENTNMGEYSRPAIREYSRTAMGEYSRTAMGEYSRTAMREYSRATKPNGEECSRATKPNRKECSRATNPNRKECSRATKIFKSECSEVSRTIKEGYIRSTQESIINLNSHNSTVNIKPTNNPKVTTTQNPKEDSFATDDLAAIVDDLLLNNSEEKPNLKNQATVTPNLNSEPVPEKKTTRKPRAAKRKYQDITNLEERVTPNP